MGDREVVLAAVKQKGDALAYASPQLRSDREVVLAAVKQNGDALCCASAELAGDRETELAANGFRTVTIDGYKCVTIDGHKHIMFGRPEVGKPSKVGVTSENKPVGNKHQVMKGEIMDDEFMKKAMSKTQRPSWSTMKRACMACMRSVGGGVAARYLERGRQPACRLHRPGCVYACS